MKGRCWMEKKVALLQPLMMRRDYGKTEDKTDKDALMVKEIPVEDYDQATVKSLSIDTDAIEDYDEHCCRCRSSDMPCFLCDR